MIKELLKQILRPKELMRCVVVVLIPALIFYAVSLAILQSGGFTVMEILRDTAQQNDTSSFIGFLSNIGTWLWVSAVAICFFVVFSQRGLLSRERKEMLVLVGAFSLLLAVDDFFMIHDRYVSQYICYFVYACSIGALLIRHYGLILAINPSAFLGAGFLLASSIFTDTFQDYIPMPYEYVQVFEEGFKFLGGALWLYFAGCLASARKVG